MAGVIVLVLTGAGPARAAPAATVAVDRGAPAGCGRLLHANVAGLLCDRAGVSRRVVAVLGRGAPGRGHGRVLAAGGLHPGTEVVVAAGRARRRTHLILVYAVAGRLLYVRFDGIGPGRATATARRARDGRLVARLHTGGVARRPAVQRPVPDAPVPPPAVAPASPAPSTTPAAGPAPPAPATPGRPGVVAGDHVEMRACGAGLPELGAPAAAFDRIWERDDAGWTGGDGALSVALPDGREAWLFGDTFLGPLAAGSRAPGSPLVSNTIVVQDSSCTTTLHGGTPAAPAALVTPPEAGWFWPAAGAVEGSRLSVVLTRFTRGGDTTAGWDFAYRDSWVATFSLPGLQQVALTRVPGSDAVQWGSALIADGGFTYVFGVEDHGSLKHAHVARAPAGRLAGPWEYFTGDRWSADPAATGRVLDGVSNLFSVVPTVGGFALVTQEPDFGLRLLAARSSSPAGPWSGLSAVGAVPDPGPGRIAYNAVAHPELSGPDGLLLSTSVNTLSAADLYADPSAYRPRFLTLPPIGGPTSTRPAPSPG